MSSGGAARLGLACSGVCEMTLQDPSRRDSVPATAETLDVRSCQQKGRRICMLATGWGLSYQ